MDERLKVFVIHGRGSTPRRPDQPEEGGDLDTVCANAFYGVWAQAIGAPHEFTFVQYHEGLLRALWDFENADIYIPDLPLDTIPDLEGDIRALAERGSRIVHFLDHHPWSQWQMDMLRRLQDEGLIDTVSMAGTRKGEVLPKDAQACATELVYDAVIRGQPWDTEGIKELNRISRMQDLNIEDNPLAVQLSKLIGYGYRKHDIVTALRAVREPEDISRLIKGMGWDIYITEHDEAISAVMPRLKRNLCEIVFRAPDHPEHTWNIVCCLAPKIYPGEPMPNVSASIRYLKAFIPMDYFFYCYGSRGLTTRKVTKLPGPLNLDTIISKICSPRDGGHPEAASGRPQSNPYFPRERLSYITGRNFIWYCRHIAKNIRTAMRIDIESTHPLRYS